MEAATEQISEHLKAFEPEQRAVLENLRAAVKELVPGATERISYQMPTFEISGQILLHFDGFQNHNSIFAGPEVGKRLANDLGSMLKSKGTIQFDKTKAFPKQLLKKLIKTRIEIINEQFPKKNGDYLSFYDNGHLKSKGKYRDGLMHGFWEFYRRDGSLMRSGNLQDGEPVGQWQTFTR